MAHEWRKLTELTQGSTIIVERVRMLETGIAVEGDFELPRLAQLPAEDQIFVAAFVHCHGSIKQMEKSFGVSYPTIKNRLARLASQLDFVELETLPDNQSTVLDRLEKGDITAGEAVKLMKEERQ